MFMNNPFLHTLIILTKLDGITSALVDNNNGANTSNIEFTVKIGETLFKESIICSKQLIIFHSLLNIKLLISQQFRQF